jgi:queuosine precursor transporter
VPTTRKQLVFFVLGGFFLTNALLGEMTGGKLFNVPSLGLFDFEHITLSIGVIPWPVVFITTDLVSEYFGKAGVRKLTFLAVGMIAYTFVILFLAIQVPGSSGSPISHDVFRAVFGQSMWIIVGSIVAFLVSQLVDVVVFVALKSRTGGRMLWLRATGSTAISQLIDTFVILFIAFVISGRLTMQEYFQLSVGNYLYKLMIAIAITPIIYLVHGMIDRFLKGDSDHESGQAKLATGTKD